MKIAMIVTGGLHPSGTEQVVPSWLELFDRLAKSHEIHAFVLRHLTAPQTYRLRNFTVHDLGRPSAALGLTRWAQERALATALDTHGPFDVIHGFWADPAGQLAARAGRRLKIPSVVSCDSGEFVSLKTIQYGSQRTWRGRRAVTEACALASRVHVCTQFMSTLAAPLHHHSAHVGHVSGGHIQAIDPSRPRCAVPSCAGGEPQPGEEPAPASRCVAHCPRKSGREA